MSKRLPTSAALLATAWLALASPSAWAEAMRFAVVVGTNEGLDDAEDRLLYAEEDARRLAEVLEDFGQVGRENLVLLLDADSEEVGRVVEEVNRRIGASRAESPDLETSLLLYFSGHADDRALHMRGSELAYETLQGLLDASPADLRIVIIDACNSGEFARLKGGTPAEPFAIETDSLLGQGIAILASSAADEPSQESDRLGGSFFTHHLVTGLLGAADRSGDARVTLDEAYRYAYDETLRSTSQAPIVQHPTYRFEIGGQEQIVLTDLNHLTHGRGRLHFAEPGSYLVFEGDTEGPLVAEVTVESANDLALNEGAYLVRRRGDGEVHEIILEIDEDATTSLELDSMTAVPYGSIVRKGLDEDTNHVVSLLLGGFSADEILPGTGALFGPSLAAQVDLEQLSAQLRLRYGASQNTNDFLVLSQNIATLDVSLLRLFDVGPLAAGVGLRGGATWIEQAFETDGEAPDRTQWVPEAGAFLQLSGSPLPWLAGFAEAEALVFFVDLEGGEADTPVVPAVTVGLMFALP